MAFNSTTFFTQLGKFIKHINLFDTLQGTTLVGPSGVLEDIQSVFTGNTIPINGISNTVVGFSTQVAGWEASLLPYAQNVINGAQGPLQSAPGTAAIFAALNEYMKDNSQSVQENTTSIGFTANAGNVGTGTIIASCLSPYGYNDQRIINDVVGVVCQQDRLTGASAGAETFGMNGSPKVAATSYVAQGSGSFSGSLTTSDKGTANILQNGSFDSFSGTPSGWTIETLAAGNWYGAYSYVTSSGESELSPSALAVVNGTQAVVWSLPASGTWPAGVTSLNFYLSNSTATSFQLQKSGITTTTVSTTRYASGAVNKTTNTSGVSNPSTAPNWALYSPGSAVSSSSDVVMPQDDPSALSLRLEPLANGDLCISQAIGNMNISAMWCALAYLTQQELTAGSTLTVELVGVSPSPMVIFNGDPETLPAASMALHSTTAWLTNIAEPVMRITWSGSSAATGSSSSSSSGAAGLSGPRLYLDSMVLAQMTSFAYWQILVVRGPVDFLDGDGFTVTTTNNNAGVIQTFLGTFYGQQVNPSASPTIPDSLAE